VNNQTDPRKLVRTRALRYDTWSALQRAVLVWCRERIAEENPSFDVAALEAQLHGWVSDWATDNDEAYRLLAGFLDHFAEIDKYLETHPLAPEKSVYAAMMAGALASRCEGSDGDFSLSIRERFRCWRLAPDDVRRPLGLSPRARLVSMFERRRTMSCGGGPERPKCAISRSSLCSPGNGLAPRGRSRAKARGRRARRSRTWSAPKRTRSGPC
jgi:hypothetical protein